MNKIQILGAYGSRSHGNYTTCLHVSNHTVIDAGNLLNNFTTHGTRIDNIFLTHSHLDHIIDIPFFVDMTLSSRDTPLTIYGLPNTLEAFKKHIFNWKIWPNFEEIAASQEEFAKIIFQPLEPDIAIAVDDIIITPFLANHTVDSLGYMVTNSNNHAFIFSGDTTSNPKMWDMINENKNITTLIADVSFPTSLQDLANSSKHYSPKSFYQDMQNLKRDNLTFYISHLKEPYAKEIEKEMKQLEFRAKYGGSLNDGDYIDINKATKSSHATHRTNKSIQSLNKIGKELSSNVDLHELLDFFTTELMDLTNADGATLYLLNEKKESLSFEIVKNLSLGIQNSSKDMSDKWVDLALYDENGKENVHMVATLCALRKEPIFIDNIHRSNQFDFSGTKRFDQTTNYHSRSMMAIPLLNHEKRVIGVLQLINKLLPTGDIVSFTKEDEDISLSLSSQIAVVISNSILVQELEILLESFLGSVITAIRAKSPHTSEHINKMVQLSNMFVEAIHNDTTTFKDTKYDKDMKQVMKFASLLHDIGKLSTPEYILDKATKLQCLYDRIEVIRLRFENAKKSAKIKLLETLCHASKDEQKHHQATIIYNQTIQQIDNDFNFIEAINSNTQYLPDEILRRVVQISKKSFFDEDKEVFFLTQDELENLTIKSGSITNKERKIINNHATVSVKILDKLPFPKKYERIPEIAGNHHEKINGTGYPKGLKGDEISFEARILAITDVFEAITASNRPYKAPNSLSSSMKILYYMAKDGELDKDLVKFFYNSGLYLKYAERYLKKSQIDKVDIDMSDI